MNTITDTQASTDTAVSTPVISQRYRTWRAEWELGLGSDGFTEYAVLEATHYGKADWMGRPEKCFRATLIREYIQRGEFFTKQKLSLAEPGVLVDEEPVDRYNQARLHDFFERALATLQELREAEVPSVELIFTAPAEEDLQ